MKYKLTRTQQSWIRWLAVWLASFTAVVVLVPGLLIRTGPGKKPEPAPPAAEQPSAARKQDELLIPVYRAKEKRTERMALEQYVRGVVAAEMPIEFEPEALKAQAMAARTYIVRRLLDGDQSNVPDVNALVTDTISHQAYVTDEELRQRWSDEAFLSRMDKLKRAVEETRDLVLTYQGKPIEASFFSTSNGYTENSEDYWNFTVPYLRSVPSPWDAKLSPRYKETVAFTSKELQRKLGLPGVVPVSAGSPLGIKVIEKSQGKRIKKLSIGGKLFTGREVREKLGLNSSQFQWSWSGGEWRFTTFGYGHGVGMSQWGANGMAMEGRKAEDIAKYYYAGIAIDRASNLLKGKIF
ncbi:stage II sporulation protein D [Paenibacillus tianmuensis]|uniref:Stage II sporulation protein D n=1 Tax=Paenibacillus tianmuensis TaxID=624147 RepID=A0A1G4RNT5_9BACL|nr:stage II sporulation protein D [Paenibacillus tianmuensis]SCW58331.1 stage II sporulation protein D [Paenibacillus tianmuensis]